MEDYGSMWQNNHNKSQTEKNSSKNVHDSGEAKFNGDLCYFVSADTCSAGWHRVQYPQHRET